MTGKGGVGRFLRIAAPYVLLGATLPGAALYAHRSGAGVGVIPAASMVVNAVAARTGKPGRSRLSSPRATRPTSKGVT